MKYWKLGCLTLIGLLALSTSAQPADTSGKATVDVQFAIETKGAAAVSERLKKDIAVLTAAIDSSRLDDSARSEIKERVKKYQSEIETLPKELPKDFRTIMPFSDLQSTIFALNAAVLRANGFGKLTAWTQNRWDLLYPMQAPDAPPSQASVSVVMMNNEYRGAAFNLTNATDEPLAVCMNLRGLPGGSNPSWISVREVLFTDTYMHVPIASALPDARYTANGYIIDVPAGMTRQVWLTFHPKGQTPEVHCGKIEIGAKGIDAFDIPIAVKIYPLDFPDTTSIALGGWDYTNQAEGALDAKLVNQKSYIKYLRDYGINTPWSAGGMQKGIQFDASGHMTVTPDTSEWERWIAKWPGAKYYSIYFNVGDAGGAKADFYGEKIGTPRFKTMVGDWISYIVSRAQANGVKPEQLMALLVDEALSAELNAVQIAWADAFKTAQPKVLIFNNPNHQDPSSIDKRFFELTDVVSPSGVQFVMSSQSYRNFYVAQRNAGKELWFYNCMRGKDLDPITYWRGTFWLAIGYGGSGVNFWAYGDEGGAPSSFNAYASPGHMFSPIFFDSKLGIVDGKHMQAIREGAEDWEYFKMLREVISSLDARGVKSPSIDAAKSLLTNGPARVLKDIAVENMGGSNPKDRSVMDSVRVDVLESLIALKTLQ